jgi:hypothetical protein
MTLPIERQTFFGIEIEICIEQEQYKSLGYNEAEVAYGEQGIPWTLPRVTGEKQSTYAGIPTQTITLSTDASCKCPDEMISAEIISPKLNIKTYRNYEEFLVKRLFARVDKIAQGRTCGIHIHWSNNRLVPKEYMEDDSFLFTLLYNLLRMSSIFQEHGLLASPVFSGRDELYSPQNRLEMVVNYIDKNVVRSSLSNTQAIPLYPVSKRSLGKNSLITLQDIYKKLDKLDHKVNWYGFNLETCKSYFTKHIKSNRYPDFLEKLQSVLTPRVLHISAGEDSVLDSLFKRSVVETISEADTLRYIVKLERIKSTDRDLLIFITQYCVFVMGVIKQLNMLEFERVPTYADLVRIYNDHYRPARIGEYLYEQDLQENERVVTALRSLKIEKPEVERLVTQADVSPINIISAIIDSNYKYSLNLIDIANYLNHHMELRIFSLDNLFREKRPSAIEIRDELRRFVVSTDRFLSEIHRKVVYFFRTTRGNPQTSEEYKRFFLYEKYAEPEEIRRRFAELLNPDQL